MSTKKIVVSTGPDGRITALLEGSESEVLTSMSQGAQMSTVIFWLILFDSLKLCKYDVRLLTSLADAYMHAHNIYKL